MNHIIVSILLDKNLADFVGKGTTEGSINFSTRKIEDKIITGLYPNSLNDKFYTAAEIMLICDQILLSTADIDQTFGELLIASSLLDKHIIFTNDNDISKFLAGIKLSSYETANKEEIIHKILAIKKESGNSNPRVDIDHAFPVKGIGTVVLGIVTSGKIKMHDEMYHSSGKQINIKSIQSQDVDIQEADTGTRVGLALKGLEHSEIEKGDILTKEKVERKGSIKAELKIADLAKEKIEKGKKYLIVSNLSHSDVTVEEINNNNAVLKLEKPLPVLKDDKFFLLRNSLPRIFASGKII